MKLYILPCLLLVAKVHFGLSFVQQYRAVKAKLPFTTFPGSASNAYYGKELTTRQRGTTKSDYKSIGRPHTSLQMAIIGPVRYSANDWLECLWTLPTSRLLKRILPQVTFLTTWTALITATFKAKEIAFVYPFTIFSVLGSALGLLLVFRTNTSYARFWEGRGIWSNVLSACRDMARDAYLHIDKKHHEKLASLLLTFAFVLKQHLQGEKVGSELEPIISRYYPVDSIQKYRNRPLHILRLLHQLIYSALCEKYTAVNEAVLHEKSFHGSLNKLSAAVSGCERIVKTPVPTSYSRHTSRFLTIYLMTLPLALVHSLGWFLVPSMLLISWSFLAIQEIGHFIEDPFNKETQAIPLGQLLSVLRSDLSESLDGVISSPEVVAMDIAMLSQAKKKCRMKDDYFLVYY